MFKKSFCSSPWFHIRINYNGGYNFCRWGKDTDFNFLKSNQPNIANISIMEYYNSNEMKKFRMDLLDGNCLDKCSVCHYEEKYNKLNGRIRQLAKSAIDLNNFELSFRSSPHYDMFNQSYTQQGHSDYYPTDLQIDLGNICNSACIMCGPTASSRLSADYKKLNKINSSLFADPPVYKSWTQDSLLVDKFINELSQIPNIRYIHFLGGETLYDEAFYLICEKLISAGLAKNIIVGTTTNGTIYDSRLERIIKEFKEFHLGVSIETLSPLNDYVRYPSQIDTVKLNLQKILQLRDQTPGLFVSLRITPNLFTIYEIDNLIEFQLNNLVTAESCNILYEPEYLRMELLPADIRKEVLEKLEVLIKKHNFVKSHSVNTRRKDLIPLAIGDTAIEYYNFIKDYQVPNDADKLRYKLVDFLKAFESIRSNSIVDYAPRYEQFLRHYGY